MLMIVIIRCEECALCRTGYRSNSLKPSNYPDWVGWAAGKKSEIFVYLTVRRILIGDTDTDRTARLTATLADYFKSGRNSIRLLTSSFSTITTRSISK